MTDRIPSPLIRGDGTGPEIVAASVEVRDALQAPCEWREFPAGLAATAAHGDPLPAATLDALRETCLALKSPLTTPFGGGSRSIDVRLRGELKLLTDVRPGLSLLFDWKFQNVDLVLIREHTGDLDVGAEHLIPIGDDPRALAEVSGFLTRVNCQRIAQFAFEHALSTGRRESTIVHKANILKMLIGLFLETAQGVGREYADRERLEDRIADNCAMQRVLNPSQFEVILTTNMLGDILSDEIPSVIGGLGLAPAANIGERGAMCKAVHGSAPDIAGHSKSISTALLLTAAMMLDHCALPGLAGRLRGATASALQQPAMRTGDLGGRLSTAEFAREVIARLA
jgi:isocitrate dehydrogenase (NAD+)